MAGHSSSARQNDRRRFGLRRVSGGLVALALLAAGCGSEGGTDTATGEDSQQRTTVKVGATMGSSDAALFIAKERGYFEEAGLDVELVQFKSASDMIAPLGAGQIQVAGGAPSAGLFNAMGRDVQLRIVADKGTNVPGLNYFSLLVRKDLVDSGKFNGFEDFKGLKIGFTGAGNTTQALVAAALESVGMKYEEAGIQEETLGFGEIVQGLENGALDAGTVVEPFTSKALKTGKVVAYPGGDFYPDQQVAVIMYGEKFAQNEEAANAFMVAYARAARDYNDAIADGKLTGEGSDEIVDILVEYTSVKDPEVHRSIGPPGINPDASVSVDSLERDLKFWTTLGLVQNDVTVDDAVDDSFAEHAVEELGAYEK
jgi:NitT/TauT family transport system substrate-binding protein